MAFDWENPRGCFVFIDVRKSRPYGGTRLCRAQLCPACGDLHVHIAPRRGAWDHSKLVGFVKAPP